MTTKEEILDAIKELSVLELNGLVKDIEESFGVSAAAPMAVAAAPNKWGRRGARSGEQTEFNVVAQGLRLRQDQRHQGGPFPLLPWA